MKKYLSEIIGEEYKEWTDGHIIFLSAHTGAGKSTFILEHLVEYAAREGKRILYLVNRSILKKQIENKLYTKIASQLRMKSLTISSENIDNVIKVELYQTIEKNCMNNPKLMDERRKDFQYIVSDECHYFLSDAMFNTNTQLSYEWIFKERENSVLIFMSATIEKIKKYIIRDLEISDKCINYNKLEKKHGVKVERGKRDYFDVVREYSMPVDYSFVEIQLLKDTEEIMDLVKKDKLNKWLIFVESIDVGEEIQKSLIKENVDSVFVDADLKKKKEWNNIIGGIIIEEKYNKQVLIATSVLDNGVSINDVAVRKIIIMATVQEEFIQMLGRKRVKCNENEKLDVYILQRSKEDFRKRLSYIEQQQRYINTFPVEHEKVLINILESDLNYRFMKNICFVEEGRIKKSKLAIAQCDLLLDYYQRIVNRFKKEGGKAFLREQSEWLNLKNIDKKIEKLMQTIPEKVSKVIETYIGRELSREDNMELRDCIRCDIKKYLEGHPDCHEEQMRKDIEHLGKISKSKQNNRNSDNTFSKDRFDRCMKYLGLNFKMKKEDNFWKIETIEE